MAKDQFKNERRTRAVTAVKLLLRATIPFFGGAAKDFVQVKLLVKSNLCSLVFPQAIGEFEFAGLGLL